MKSSIEDYGGQTGASDCDGHATQVWKIYSTKNFSRIKTMLQSKQQIHEGILWPCWAQQIFDIRRCA